MEVAAINYIIKTRAVRYIASSQEEWLYPEQMIGSVKWPELDAVLQHKGDPWKLAAAETMIRYTDGSLQTVSPYGERDLVPGWFMRSRESKAAAS